MSDENQNGVSVTAGANGPEKFPGLIGKTVGTARQSLAPLYGIADDAAATVNGRSASDSETLRENDVLVFGKSVARKGN